MRFIFTTNLAFLVVEFDILKSVIGINSKIKSSDLNRHYNLIDVDVHDKNVLEKIYDYYKGISNHRLIYRARTSKGYHLIYTPCHSYFAHLFDLARLNLIDPDFFYYSFRRGFSTLRISGSDIQIEYMDSDALRNMVKEVSLIKYKKRMFPFQIVKGKRWFDRRKKHDL